MDMLATPTLSVIVPTYNRCESLRITLDALQRQDFPRERFEVVVVSDGSTDGTEAFLRDYAAASPMTLRPIFQQNGGPARARNRGIQEARNEIVLFIDDDVEPLPGFLSAHAAHHADDDCVVVIGPMSPDPARARQEPVWVAWEHAMLGKQYESFASGAWPTAGPHHFYTGNSSLRRAHLLAVGGFDESFKRQEDVEMAYRMQRQCGVRFVFDSAPDGIHRPQRAFASWLKVAYEYGRLDVVRAGRGDVSWALLRLCYRERNALTKLVARLGLPTPPLGSALRRGLSAAARMLYALPGPARGASLRVLSALYNLHYLEGARDELGGWAELQPILMGQKYAEEQSY
jgi:glycosyltransferase involved in cell wall biosynthesis